MREYWLKATEAWPPYLILAGIAVCVLVKGLRLRRLKQLTPPPGEMDDALIERLNAGRPGE